MRPTFLHLSKNHGASSELEGRLMMKEGASQRSRGRARRLARRRKSKEAEGAKVEELPCLDSFANAQAALQAVKSTEVDQCDAPLCPLSLNQRLLW